MLSWISLAVSVLTLAIVVAYVGFDSPHARKKRAKKALRRLPEFDRGAAAFKRRYPAFEYGAGTYGVPEVHDFGDGAQLRIGAYCSIADGVEIVLGGYHRTDWVSTYPFPKKISEARHIDGSSFSKGDVQIGSDVWLCSNATILSGVTIGPGAVVAAGAVVTRDIEPYAIVAGNPARVIGWRFDERTRNALLAIQWWNWPRDEVIKVVELLCSRDADQFLEYAAQRQPAL